MKVFVSFKYHILAITEEEFYKQVRLNKVFQAYCQKVGIELNEEGCPVDFLAYEAWASNMDDWILDNCECYEADLAGKLNKTDFLF